MMWLVTQTAHTAENTGGLIGPLIWLFKTLKQIQRNLVLEIYIETDGHLFIPFGQLYS
jgi:hypothetical protein